MDHQGQTNKSWWPTRGLNKFCKMPDDRDHWAPNYLEQTKKTSRTPVGQGTDKFLFTLMIFSNDSFNTADMFFLQKFISREETIPIASFWLALRKCMTSLISLRNKKKRSLQTAQRARDLICFTTDLQTVNYLPNNALQELIYLLSNKSYPVLIRDFLNTHNSEHKRKRGSRVVSALASCASGPGFDPRPAARKICWSELASLRVICRNDMIQCAVLRIGTLTGCPLCRDRHPLCRLKIPTQVLSSCM